MTGPTPEQTHELFGELIATLTLLANAADPRTVVETNAQAERAYGLSPPHAVVGLAGIAASWYWRLAVSQGMGPDSPARLAFPREPIMAEVPSYGGADVLVACVNLAEALAMKNDPRQANKIDTRPTADAVIQLGTTGFMSMLGLIQFLGFMVVDCDPSIPDLAALIAIEGVEHEQGWLERGGSYE